MEEDEDEDDLDRDLDLAFSTLNRDSLLFQDGGGLHVMGGVPKQQAAARAMVQLQSAL